jgi:hypothetical protein
MIKRSWLLALALGASSGVAQAQAVSGEQAQAAERLFESGTRAFEASEYSRAIDELAESYRLFPSYRTACGLGQVELHLSRYRDAAQHLDFCLKNFPNGDVPTQQRILAGLTEARRRVFALAVRVNVTDAEVRIDGKLVGTVPRADDFFVGPGNHRVEVRKSGYQSVTAEFFFPSGGQRDWLVKLQPSTQDAGSEASSSGGAGYVLVTGAALTGVLVAGGVLFRVSAASAASDARELQRAVRNSGDTCPPDAQDRMCSNLRNALDRQDQLLGVSSISLISGAGTAAVTALLYGWMLNRGQPAEVAVGASADARHVALSVAGRF